MTPATASMMLIQLAEEELDRHECDTEWCYPSANPSTCGYRKSFSDAIDTIKDLIPPAERLINWSDFYRDYPRHDPPPS